jgi:hypothetical protein
MAAPVNYPDRDDQDNLINPETGQPETKEQRELRLQQASPAYGVPTTETQERPERYQR